MTPRIERMLDDVRIRNYGKLALLTVAAAAAAVMIALTSMTSSELTAGEAETPAAASGDFTYYPGQYVNKATGPSDHIPSF